MPNFVLLFFRRIVWSHLRHGTRQIWRWLWLDNTQWPTTSSNTGPDKAKDGDFYIYTEASEPREKGDVAMYVTYFAFLSCIPAQAIIYVRGNITPFVHEKMHTIWWRTLFLNWYKLFILKSAKQKALMLWYISSKECIRPSFFPVSICQPSIMKVQSASDSIITCLASTLIPWLYWSHHITIISPVYGPWAIIRDLNGLRLMLR